MANDTVAAWINRHSRTIRAGEAVYLHIIPEHCRTYNLICCDGTVVTTAKVSFTTEWVDPKHHEAKAVQMLRDYDPEVKLTKKAHKVMLKQWEEDRHDWEMMIIFYAWDNKLAVFLPYVQHREQLGDKQIDILKEWTDTPD